MSNSTENKYTSKDFRDKAIIASLIERLIDAWDFEDCSTDVSVIARSTEETANFWLEILNYVRYAICREYPEYENRVENRLKRQNFIRERFGFDLLKLVLIHSSRYVNSDLRYLLASVYPKLDMIEATNLVGWQCFREDSSSKHRLKLFDTLNNLPKNPFNDSRFKAIPIHTKSMPRGHAHSEWLKDVEGHYQRLWDKEKEDVYVKKLESAYSYFYMDAKLGVLFTFKDRPSFRTCFNVDQYNNVFVHQIQSMQKARGHYKLGADWRMKVIGYLQEMFPKSKIYIIDGANAANDTASSYGDKTPLAYRPNAETLARIKETYNNFQGMFNRRRRKMDRFFRRVV